MAEIFHVTPITPDPRLVAISPRNLMVSHYRPDQLTRAIELAPFLAFDNGAFSIFSEMMRIRKRIAAGKERVGDRARLIWLEMPRDWRQFYSWLEPILFAPGRWAVIPDVINEGSQAQDALIRQWPHGQRGVPVWHTGEPIERLLRLLDEWPRVCIGSTDEHWQVGGEAWLRRMDEAWTEILRRHSDPIIHMLRGTAVHDWFPFFSADSSSVGQNSHRYNMPLYGGTADAYSGAIAYAHKLEGPTSGRPIMQQPHLIVPDSQMVLI